MTWISILDDLPDESHAVLVYAPEYKNTYMAYWSGLDWKVWAPGVGCRPFPQWVKVTHWMPLPEPPKEEEYE